MCDIPCLTPPKSPPSKAEYLFSTDRPIPSIRIFLETSPPPPGGRAHGQVHTINPIVFPIPGHLRSGRERGGLHPHAHRPRRAGGHRGLAGPAEDHQNHHGVVQRTRLRKCQEEDKVSPAALAGPGGPDLQALLRRRRCQDLKTCTQKKLTERISFKS